MHSNLNNHTNNKREENLDKNEIDLAQLYSILYRYRKLIYSFSFSGLIISTFIAFNTKRTWEGQFQIVMRLNNRLSSFSSAEIDPVLASLTKGLGAKKLATEVEILKSPLVLQNTFEFFKKEKQLDSKSVEFLDWTNSVNIGLTKRTSILNVAYKDKQKDLIIPVLKRISSTYQEYSGRSRKRQIDLSIDFLKKQLDNYRAKSLESFTKSQKFALKHDLSILNPKTGLNIKIQDSLNIDDLVDPRMTTVSRIMEHVHKGSIGSVYSLLDGEYEFIEAKISEKSELVNKKIRDSNLPEDIRIGAIIRDEKVIIPRSNFIFEKNDLVVFLAKREELKAVESIFSLSTI